MSSHNSKDEYSVEDQFGGIENDFVHGYDLSSVDSGVDVTNEFPTGARLDETIKNKVTAENFITTIDIAKIIKGVRKHTLIMALIVASGIGLAVLSYYKLQGTSCSTTMRLLYKAKENKVASLGALSSFALEPYSRSTVVSMIQYASVLTEVTNRLNMSIDVEQMEESLKIINNDDSEIIRLEYFTELPPEQAVWILNTIADCAIEYNVNLYRSQVVKVYEQFAAQASTAYDRLNMRKREIEDFQKEMRILEPSAEHQAYLGRVSGIYDRLSQVRLRLSELTIQISNYKEQMNDMPDEIVSSSYENSPFKRKMSNLTMALMDARTKFSVGNPKVKMLEKQLEEVRKAMNDESTSTKREQIFQPNPLKAEMEGELIRLYIQKAAAEDSVQKLEKEAEDVRNEFNDMPKRDLKYATLIQKKISDEQIYERLKASAEHSKIATTTDLADFEVLEYAKDAISYGSGAAKAVPIVLVILSIGGALFMSLLLEFGDSYLRTRKEIESAYNIPCISSIINYKSMIAGDTYYRMIHYLRELSNQIPLLEGGGAKQVVGFFSTAEGEGKSTISSNLAQYFASVKKKTVYIDFDYRANPWLNNAEYSGEVGLIAYLKTDIDICDIIFKHEGVDFLKSESFEVDMPELIRSQNMARLWGYLKNEYEAIVIDVPQVFHDAAAIEIARLIDVPIFVIASPKTKKSAADSVVDLLERNGIRLSATILNMVAPMFIPDNTNTGDSEAS